MKPIFKTTSRLSAALALVATCPLYADTITLNAGGDGFGASSFNTAGAWSNAAEPTPGNDYHVAVSQLRSPADGASYTFQGDSLSIDTNGVFLYKGAGTTGVLTIPKFVLNGGKIDHSSSTVDVGVYAGEMEVAAVSTIHAKQGAITISADVSGTANLIIPITNNENSHPLTFSGTNSYTGDLLVAGNVVLDPAGTFSFSIGANGVNNSITGAGIVNLGGVIDLDLSSAGTAEGDSWLLVDAATLTESYGGGFVVMSDMEPWYEVEATPLYSIWVSPGGDYQFSELTGTLTRVEADSDQDGLPDSWELAYYGNQVSSETGADDPDGDFCSHYLEFLAGSDPESVESFPDTDTDLLPDGWEYLYFGNLDESGDGDWDDDWNSNLIEYSKNTDPTGTFDYPDEDDNGSGDGVNDGWEIFYFGGIESCDPDEDSDGDLFSNLDEFFDGFDPTDQESSPDTDDFFLGDGLPDGWEVKYFRVGNEDLESVIVRQGPDDDPDGDGISNRLEYLAGTIPTDMTSVEKTLGYWRFEEATAGEVPAGANNQYAFPTSIQDSGVYGNHMMAWADYSRPNYDLAVPAATVPATGVANSSSLFFQRNNSGIYYIEAIFSTPTAYLDGGVASLRNYVFDEFTVETSFKTTLSGTWQVPVAKFGNPIGGQPPFSIKIDPDNLIRAGLVDGAGAAAEIVGTTTVVVDTWYSVAVTGTATEMQLWLKGPGDAGYSLEGEAAIAGAWYEPEEGPLNTPWNIGQGMWNGAAADPFEGHIDEVKISAVALDPEQFLFYTESSFGTWAEANISDSEQRGQEDDPDGDGTPNIAEFILGLDPEDGSEFFTATLASDGTLRWLSAAGVSFVIQRSTTLVEPWEDLLPAVTGTGPVDVWTDPAPPVGKAFYRVVFDTN